jgi:hypothetical protein
VFSTSQNAEILVKNFPFALYECGKCLLPWKKMKLYLSESRLLISGPLISKPETL